MKKALLGVFAWVLFTGSYATNFPTTIDCSHSGTLPFLQTSLVQLDDPTGKYEFSSTQHPFYSSFGGEILSQTATTTKIALACIDADQFFVVQEKANPANFCYLDSSTELGLDNTLITKPGPLGLKCTAITKGSFAVNDQTKNYLYSVQIVSNKN